MNHNFIILILLLIGSCSKQESVAPQIRPQYRKAVRKVPEKIHETPPRPTHFEEKQKIQEGKKAPSDLPQMEGAVPPKVVPNVILPQRRPGDPDDNPKMEGFKADEANKQAPVIMPDGKEYKGLGDM